MSGTGDIESELLAFVRAEFGSTSAQCELDTALFSDGLLDSFSMVTLLAFVEERWQVPLLDADVAVAMLDSIRTLAAYVESNRIAVQGS